MLMKRYYFIHFARLLFTGLASGLCALFAHRWQTHQPIIFTLEWQQCQSSLSHQQFTHVNIYHWSDVLPSFLFWSTAISTRCHTYIKNVYSINIIQCLGGLRWSLFIYFIYHLIRLAVFHRQFQYEQIKRNLYAHLYRVDLKNEQETRCSNRLLLT